jgi:hypothetical protein
MRQVDSLLQNLSNDSISTYTADTETEPRIVIGRDRFISVPSELKKIGVEDDNNAETLTFDCPRYWDQHDLSRMVIYIRYRRPDKSMFSYIATDIVVDENDPNVMHFNWTISKNVTQFRGNIQFLVCIENTEGIEWHTELCNDLYISEGMDHAGFENEVESDPDILTQLLELNRITLERATVYVGPGEMPDWADVQLDPDGTDGQSAYDYAKKGGFLGTEEDFYYKLAQDIPDKLANPFSLTINGVEYDGSVPVELTIEGGGGGTGSGGGSNNAVITLTNTSGWISNSIALGSSCVISATWGSTENDIPTGDGSLSIKVNGITKINKTIKQGSFEEDLKEYLSLGTNTVMVRVADVYGNSRTIVFTIITSALSIVSSFDASVAYTGDIKFTYTPVGAVEKHIYIVLDDKVIHETVVTSSGRQQSFTIPAPSHGSHTLKVYFKAVVNGVTAQSNTLYYEIVCVERGNNTPIIACAFDNTDVEQYVTIAIPYLVYSPNSLTSQITLTENGETLSNLTVDRTYQIWSYRPMTVGENNLTIVCGDTVKSISLNVAESTLPVEAETEDLSLYLSSHGRSNNEETPGAWSYGDISAELTGFNFVSDGWITDEDGVTALRVAGKARVNIPYRIFETDCRTNGKTIEIEFATRNVMNYDAVLFSCLSGGRGIEVTTQRAYFASEKTSIGTQYKEEEHVRLTFVIEKKTDTKLVLCYINGILSGSVLYPDNDDFSQLIPVGITIGSNDCTTDIYCIRVYDNNLTRYQVLDNWIADTQLGQERNSRYKRNNIYDDYDQMTIATLKDDVPYLILECPVLPSFKGDKKTCSGSYVDPVNTQNSFSFANAEIDVQGTSSQYYYVKNFKIKFKGGFILWDGKAAEVYQMDSNAIPTSTFTMKADVASSEGANNVVLAQLYNDLCPVATPPQEEDPRIRQTIDGHPIVIFWNNGTETTFVGKYNFNNDKGTEEIFGFEAGDESWEIRQNGTERVGWRSADFSGNDWKNDFEARYPEDNVNVTNLKAFAEWLVSTNTEAATGKKLNENLVYDTGEKDSEGNSIIVTYTHDTAEYRLAKFKTELANHADVDALIFYYLFTEIFLCIDQREKNAFPTLWDETNKWMVLFYDADSSLGTDNKGNLAFDYYLEDIDYTEAGDPVYNGQNSVLWKNLRAGFYDKISEEYKRLRTTIRTDGSGLPLIGYEIVNNKFENHQSIWSEAIYNEDGYRKCIEPLVVKGDTTYLPMLQGKKEQHRKWWLYNRFRYLDSKYITGSSMDTRILIRSHAKSDVTLTSYVNMYGHVYYNAEMIEHRMSRGQSYTFEWSATGAEDTVIGINDADMLTSLGDLSPLMIETIDISAATHLVHLKIGDSSENYVNRSLNVLTLGNNKLLKVIDARNCVNLAQSIDASGCSGLEEAYFDNTAIVGISLPNGSGIKKLHLPATVADLTLRNCTELTEFVIPTYANITTLRLENNSTTIDPIAILSSISAKSRVRIIGFDWEMTNSELSEFIDILDSMRGLDENGNTIEGQYAAQVGGKIYVAEINGVTLNRAKKYVGLTIEYGSVFLNSTRLVERTLSGKYVNDRVTKVGQYAMSNLSGITVHMPNVIMVEDNSFSKTKFVGASTFESAEYVRFGYADNSVESRIVLPKVTDFEAVYSYVKIYDIHSTLSLSAGCLNGRGPDALILRSQEMCTLKSSPLSWSGTMTVGGSGRIYVPRSLVDSYKTATNWSNYAEQFLAIEDYPEICGGGE